MKELSIREAAEGDQVHTALKAAIEVERHAYLWTPDDGVDFVPRVCSDIFGDGRALLRLTTMNSRPRFYVIRIDSSWDVEDYRAPAGSPNLRDFLDDIAYSLEDQFGDGRAREEDDEPDDDESVRDWPAFDCDNGMSWGRMDWPVGIPAELDPHPFARCNVLSDFGIPAEKGAA